LLFVLAAAIALSSCGIHFSKEGAKKYNLPATSRDQVNLCVYVEDLNPKEAVETMELIYGAWRNDAEISKIDFSIVELHPWKRRGFTINGIVDEINKVPLRKPCERNMTLVGRNIGDILYAAVLLSYGVIGEYLGATNHTMTHAYVVRDFGSLAQLFIPPKTAIRHELLHLLGCRHANEECYERILRAKKVYEEGDKDFFPAFTLNGDNMLLTREEVNKLLGIQEQTQVSKKTSP